MSEKHISQFLDSFDAVKESRLRPHVVKQYLLSTRDRIIKGLDSDRIHEELGSEGVCYLSTYGLSVNYKATSKFALRDVNSISDSYWDSVQRFYQENGYSTKLNDTLKNALFDAKLKERKDSYTIWLSYLASSDASYIPKYLHAWILHGLEKIGSYNENSHKFKVRKPNTMDGFVQLHSDCVALAVESMHTKITNSDFCFEDSYLNNIFKQSKYPTFKTLYEYFYSKKFKSADGLLEVLEQTKGKWIEYNSKDESHEVSKILKNYPALEWCIKAKSTAETYLSNGTFYIYFSDVPSTHPNKNWVKNGYPRLCIRTIEMNGVTKIAETRGCAKGQSVDDCMFETKILESKLGEFGAAGVKYLEIKSDLDRFNAIYNKFRINNTVSEEDYDFILKCRHRFFGYDIDNRVSKLKFYVQKKDDIDQLNSIYDKFRNNKTVSHADFTFILNSPNKILGSEYNTKLFGIEYKTKVLELHSYVREFLKNTTCVRGWKITKVVFEKLSISKVDFGGADLSDIDLSHVNLNLLKCNTKTVLPTGYKCLKGIVLGRRVKVKSLDCSRKNLRGLDFTNANLSELNFRGSNLSGVDFSGANLNGVDFRGANLTGVNFRNARLSQAMFDDTTKLPKNSTLVKGFLVVPGLDLSNKKFGNADLRGVDLSGVNLYGADVSKALFDETTVLPSDQNSSYMPSFTKPYMVLNRRLLGKNLVIKKIDASGCDLTNLSLERSNLSKATFRGANLTGVDFRGANLQGANLMGTNLTGVDLRGANLQGVILGSADLSGFDFQGADLSGANLQGAYLNQANLSNTNLLGANLIYAKLRNANLFGANLTDVKLMSAICLYANFTLSDLTRAKVNGADFSFAKFNQTILSDVIWYRAILNKSYTVFFNQGTSKGVCLGPNAYVRGGNLSGDDLSDINISGATIYDLNCSSSSFVNADLSNTYLESVNFESVDFTNANFSGAELNNVNFTGSNITLDQLNLAILDDTTSLPEGMVFDRETGRVVEA